MAGVQGQVLGHLVRRGVSAAQNHLTGANTEYIQQLEHDAQLYDNTANPDADWEVQAYEMIPLVITAIITFVVIAAIRYSVGEVTAALTMIESPTSLALISSKDAPPAYADEPDAPLEKEPLMPSEAEADVEVMLVDTKPITAKISTTMAHLYKVGGATGKFRGWRASVWYHLIHSMSVNLFVSILGVGLFGNALIYIFVSLATARLHMAWTHAMIATASPKPFWRRMVPAKQAKAILLPTLVQALAEQATWMLPVVVAFAVGLPDLQSEHVVNAAKDGENCQMGMIALRVLAVPATALFVAVAILLPATVTLTRIEAALLPEDQQTIVPFDREALVGELDMTARGSSKAIFVQAWRSFDSASRWRLIKLYIKMAMIELGVVFVAAHLMVAEMYVIGGEKLAVFFKSVSAQLQLMAMEGQDAQWEVTNN